MKRKLFFGGLLALACLGMYSSLSAQKTVTRDVSGFSAIIAGSVFEITVNKGSSESLVIEADEQVMPYVRSEVKNGVLELYVDGNKLNNVKKLKAIIGVKELKRIELSGAAKLTSADLFETPVFHLALSGASAVQLKLKVNKLNVNMSGASSLNLEVDAQEAVNFNASGSSHLSARFSNDNTALSFAMSGSCKAEVEGRAKRVGFELSGACTVHLNDFFTNKPGSAKLSGICKLLMTGDVLLDVMECSGSSKIHSNGIRIK
jgi:hypothetical protein